MKEIFKNLEHARGLKELFARATKEDLAKYPRLKIYD